MKHSGFLIFIAIVLAVHTLINYYIFIRGWQALPNIRYLKIAYIAIFVFLFLSYILARLLEKSSLSGLANFLNWVGSLWMAAMLYFFLLVLSFDLIRAANYFIGFFPAFITTNWALTKLYTIILSVVSVSAIILLGYINSINPQFNNLKIKINKKVENLDRLKIAVISDIHIGNLVNARRVGELVEKLNSVKPDLILFPGDILDEDIYSVTRDGMGNPLKKLSAPYGIFACTGNHEYIGGVEPAVKYIESLGIRVLRDEAVNIDGKFWIVGREDRDIIRFAGKQRKKLSEIMKNVDKKLPVIMMDHQPFGLNDAVDNGIDIQVSGHTHHGQLFPLNLITNLIYEVSWGYKQKGNTHIYVSSGYGTWGPPVRLGNTPEITFIELRFWL